MLWPGKESIDQNDADAACLDLESFSLAVLFQEHAASGKQLNTHNREPCLKKLESGRVDPVESCGLKAPRLPQSVRLPRHPHQTEESDAFSSAQARREDGRDTSR